MKSNIKKEKNKRYVMKHFPDVEVSTDNNTKRTISFRQKGDFVIMSMALFRKIEKEML